MKPRRSIAIVAFAFLVFMSFFSGDDFIHSASSININNIDEVEIDCDQYMAGLETIDVYSNASVKNYALRINGTLIDSATNPVQYASHYWNNSFWQVRTGTQTGTDNGLVVNTNGSDYIAIASSGAGIKTAAGSFWFYNATAPDISYIQNATVYFSVMVSGGGTGTFNNLRFQRWNGLTATWTNEITVAGGSRGTRYNRQLFYTGANLTTMFAQRDSRTLNVGFGVQSEISGGGASHTLYIYYLAILYKVNKPIEAFPSFKLVDTHVLNTTAYADGTYNISASITDFSNKVFTDYKIVKIDNTKPSIPSISYSPASPNNTYPVTITSSVSDPNLDYSEGQYTNQFGYYITIPNYLSTTFTFKDFFTNGTYTFYFYARDKSGNYRSVSTTFTVSYVNNVVYIYNPVVEIEMEASKSDLGDPINYNITVQHVGRLKIFVNNTLNQTVENPSGTYGYSINSAVAAKFIVTFQVFYDNDTFFRNSTFTLYFAETDVIVYVYKPSVIISYPSNTTTGATAKITMNCSNCGSIKAYVNGTLNQTFTSPSNVFMTLTSSTPKTFNVTLEIYYLNSTLYKKHSFLVKFVSPAYVYIYINKPSVIIGYPSNTTTGASAKITMNCTSCGNIKAYVNGTLNQTFVNATNVYMTLSSTTPKTFNVTLEIYYLNGTLFKKTSFLVKFVNPTYVYIYNPDIIIGYPSMTTVGNQAKITINCTNCGTIKAYVNGTLNQTFTSPDNEYFFLIASSPRTFNVTIEIRYVNGTFYKNSSFLVRFSNPATITYTQPLVIIGYPSNTTVGSQAKITLNCTNSGTIKAYVNGTLNQTFASPTNEYFFLTSSTPKTFNVTIEIRYVNGTFYKNCSFLARFSNPASVIVSIPEPLVIISYPSNTTTGSTAKITLNCTNCGTIKAYVNGTLNQTFTSPGDEEFTLSSAVKRTFSIVIEIRYTNGTFFQNTSFQVRFVEPLITFIYLPTFIYSYTNNTYDNVTLDIIADNVQKVDVYKDGSLDLTFPGTSVDESFAYFSPVHVEYEISLIIYYLNGTMYKNITVYLVIRQYVAPVYALTIEPRRVDYKGEIVPSSYYDLFINGTKTTSLFIPFTPGDDIRVVFVSDFEDTMYDQLIVTGSSNMTVVAELDMYWLSLNNNRDDDVQVRISRNDIVLSIVLDPQTTKRVLLYDKTYAIEWILDYDATPGAVAPITDGGDLDMNDDRSVDFNPSGLQVTPLTIFIIIIGIGAAVGVFVVLGIQEFIVNVPGKKKTPSGRSTGSAAKTTSKAGRSSNLPRKSPVPRKKSSPQLRPRQRLHTRTRGMR